MDRKLRDTTYVYWVYEYDEKTNKMIRKFKDVYIDVRDDFNHFRDAVEEGTDGRYSIKLISKHKATNAEKLLSDFTFLGRPKTIKGKIKI